MSKRFTSVTAVDELSFDVERGSIFALLGPNGAGKSTTVRMITGITRPDTGELGFSLDGDAVTRRPDPAQLGYLPEERGLYPDQKILDTLIYLARLRGIDAQAARERAMNWLDRFGLAGRAIDKVNALSKGNQQKVQFIASVLHEPRLAVLDEPFSGFDPVNQDLVSSIIRELKDQGMTVVLSAHHMDLVEDLADYILLMHQGRTALEGTMATIRATTAIGQRLNVTFAGSTEDIDLEAIPGVERVLNRTSSTARLALLADVTAGSVLHDLTGRAEVVDVATDTPTLREIYLQTVTGEAA